MNEMVNRPEYLEQLIPLRIFCPVNLDGKTLQRELRPLESIRDHNPKYLITMDFTLFTSYNGIKQINALEWLLENK